VGIPAVLKPRIDRMTDFPLTQVLAGLALATTFGGMTFFSGVMAPLIFTKLPLETAGTFMRHVFPWYYLAMGMTTLVSLAMLLISGDRGWPAILTGVALAGFVYARQGLMPCINEARDGDLQGDPKAARRFKALHRLSVLLNGLQWLAVLTALVLVLR
jgi:hypothetical protein